jgi:hypothetical protein
MSIHDRVTKIIDDEFKEPTIVNPTSNFVVVTYWWGEGD